SWRRKAPVESLMPLRLAKYGVPLAETAPAGLAAAGIELPPELLPAPRAPQLAAAEQPHGLHLLHQEDIPVAAEHSRATGTPPNAAQAPVPSGHPTDSFNAFEPTPRRSMALAPERRTITAVIDPALPAPRSQQTAQQRNALERTGVDLMKTPENETELLREETDAEPAPASALAGESAPETEPEPAPASDLAPEVQLAPGAEPVPEQASVPDMDPVEPLTTVDQYYLAWTQYLQQHGHEPRDAALSQHLAENGMTGRGGAPVSPSTLRRYLPHFRIYSAWSRHLDQEGETPTSDQLFSALAGQGITGTPYTLEKVAPLLADFPRRRAALAAHASRNLC
ncbi:hypothetical protein ABT185_28840, partial [Streptomyces clavifer]